MEEIPSTTDVLQETRVIHCKKCHIQVRSTDYFCFNCGENLQPAPPDTALATVITQFIGALILPPMGIVWGYKYIKSNDLKAKIIGWILIVGTIIELVILTKITIETINTVNDQVNKQMMNLQGF